MLAPLLRAARRRPLFTPGPEARRVDIGREQIESMLPHRDPFLLLDHIEWVDLKEGAISGRRYIDPDDPVFAGHFPGDPVYPGVLLIEMMGQLGLCLQYLSICGDGEVESGDEPPRFRLLKVHQALFLEAVQPGETVEVQARTIEDGDYVSTCVGQVLGDDKVRALAVSEVYCQDV